MSEACALLIHPNPDNGLLDSILPICNAVVLSPQRHSSQQSAQRNSRVTQYWYTPGQDLLELAIHICRAHKINAVPPLWEGMVESVSAITAALGLSGNPLSATQSSRDKYLASLRFAEHKIPHPRTKLCDAALDRPAQIESDAEYPFIVKLPRSTNSHSVALIRSREELSETLDVFRRLYRPDSPNRLSGLYLSNSGRQPFLVQDYVAGLELNIDLLYTAADHRILGIFEKYPMTGPTFEEVQSVYPVNLDQEALNLCISTAVNAVRALGAVDGAAHVELRMSNQGPAVIEVALRPGGFYTPRAIRYLTGVDPIAALTKLLLNHTLPQLDLLPKDRACLYGAVNVAHEGRIKTIFSDDFARRTRNLLEWEILKRPGDWITPLPAGTDYHLARFILGGEFREQLETTAEIIRRSITVEMEAPS